MGECIGLARCSVSVIPDDDDYTTDEDFDSEDVSWSSFHSQSCTTRKKDGGSIRVRFDMKHDEDLSLSGSPVTQGTMCPSHQADGKQPEFKILLNNTLKDGKSSSTQ
ncbi:hypothetical protein LOTGIDRAFT_167842 [Lottia gigantea]|uniref:Uncharacterized protein n=1 Tax=Lottia gigantea TaxID=225164 RepID=V3Z3P7_LOTGI|nr:hypothetical protein LOTGIDRAFT_167842 [Lottia gigantea]ESO85268.1 hypothetical protein LOTGIDRAFT_167842 [Lottia gigantea]